MNSKERLKHATAIYNAGNHKVATTPEPKGQKFPVGSRVRIADDLGASMLHFSGKGQNATVLYTYAHAYWGDDCKSYALDIDGQGVSSWYYEHQLTAIVSDSEQE